MSMYRVISYGVGRGCLLWPMCSLGKTLLAICLLLQVSLDFLLLHSSPLWWKGHLFVVLVLEGLVGLHQFSSVQFSHSVMSNSLWPHGPQHAKPPCPSPTPRVYPNSCPSSLWCHPTISSSVIPFSSCPQSLPASGFFNWVSSSQQVAKVLEF